VQVDQIAGKLDAEHKQAVDKVKNLDASTFDRQFLQLAIDDHRKDISDYEKAATDLTNTELQQFAVATLPVLKLHLQKAQDLMRDVGASPTFEREGTPSLDSPGIGDEDTRKEMERSPVVPETEEPKDY
jgi:hypothetical protein